MPKSGKKSHNAERERAKAQVAVRMAEHEEGQKASRLFYSKKILATNESLPSDYENNTQRLMLSVINTVGNLPESPIAAVHIVAINETDAEDHSKRKPRLFLGFALRNRAGKDFEELAPVNNVLKARGLPLVKQTSTSAVGEHDKFIRERFESYPFSREQTIASRDIYDIPEKISLQDITQLRWVDPVSLSVIRSFINQVTHKELLEKGKEQQKLILSRRIGAIAKSAKEI